MIGSLFSGIGGLELGLERVGFGPVAFQIEIDPWCRRILAKHWPNATRLEDVRAAGVSNLHAVDVLCGGFPCQDVSSAGKGAGLAGARSGLWSEFRRILSELRSPFAVIENVASGARRWLPFVRRDLHVLGYRTRAIQVSAFDVGAPHRRERVFVLAAYGNGNGIRIESGRVSGSDWTGSSLAECDGAARALADADQLGRWRNVSAWQPEAFDVGAGRTAADSDDRGELQQGWGFTDQWRWSRDGGRWRIEPPVRGVVDGLPGRVDRSGERLRRLKGLGNAVVPQCAEVAGLVLREWAIELSARAA